MESFSEGAEDTDQSKPQQWEVKGVGKARNSPAL